MRAAPARPLRIVDTHSHTHRAQWLVTHTRHALVGRRQRLHPLQQQRAALVAELQQVPQQQQHQQQQQQQRSDLWDLRLGQTDELQLYADLLPQIERSLGKEHAVRSLPGGGGQRWLCCRTP
jgi:hypothetical protein